MNKCTGKVCSECPYRKNAAPGYFGGNPMEGYSIPIIQDIETACHLTIGSGKERYCSGLAGVRVNTFKSARNPAGVIGRSEDIMKQEEGQRQKLFRSYKDFINYHSNEN